RLEVGAVLRAVPTKDLALARELFGSAVEVRVAGVLRGDAERHLLAAACHPDRDAALLHGERTHDRAVDPVVLAVEVGVSALPRLAEDLHALVEHAQTLGRLGESVAVRAPLVLVPARADPHLEPAPRHVVDRRGD